MASPEVGGLWDDDNSSGLPMKRKYYVTTYDADLYAFTPQKGVRTGPYTLFGLRKALRKLQALGYPCNRDDPSVLVECREVMKAIGKAFMEEFA